jgi:ribosomal protein L11 methyltransferase
VIRLAVRVKREQAELVLAELLELAPAGVEEVGGSDHVEYAVYGSAGELPSLPELRAAVGGALVEISTSETADDWHERWKRFHRPVIIRAPALAACPVDSRRSTVSALRVRPPWDPPAQVDEPASGPVEKSPEEIVIDPGQAFGTGAHASTRLCLELLLSLALLERQRGAVLDLGTGSGVLAIAAARLGFGPVLALDNEPESVQAARENAACNGVDIDVERLDLRRQAPRPPDPRGAWSSCVVLANLLAPLLLELARSVPQAPKHLIAGGLLAEQLDEVAEAFSRRLGLRERERRTSGGWAALWLSPA